ncbi:MAG TPA: hypothetical protein VFE61_01910 [Candidatus Sulfotelmatobacter sp.]|nr:hypothetical protein [Candidatus Sulfotelmatobacter sp.]
MKQNIFFPALVLTLFVLVIGATRSNGQQAALSSSVATNESLPNAPSTTQVTPCKENNGQPCPEWVHKLIGQYPPLPESTMTYATRDPATVHFWTYRGLQDPPLRNNKEVFRSKIFLATHVGGAIAMIVACRTKNSKEDWGSEARAVPARFGMDYLQFRFVGGPSAVAPAIYEMIHYSRASTR